MIIQELLKKYRRGWLYHFTNKSNIENIKRHGIYSRALLEENCMKYKPGGNPRSIELDKQFGMDRFIHLSYAVYNPMRSNIEFVNYDTWVAVPISKLSEETLYSDYISNAQNTNFFCEKDVCNNFFSELIRERVQIMTESNTCFKNMLKRLTDILDYDLKKCDFLDSLTVDEIRKRFPAIFFEILIPNRIPPEKLEYKDGN